MTRWGTRCWGHSSVSDPVLKHRSSVGEDRVGCFAGGGQLRIHPDRQMGSLVYRALVDQ